MYYLHINVPYDCFSVHDLWPEAAVEALGSLLEMPDKQQLFGQVSMGISENFGH